MASLKMRGLVHDIGGKNERAVGIVRRILPIAWLLAAMAFCSGAHAAPPRERPPRMAPEEIVLHGFDADGNELALRVPTNIAGAIRATTDRMLFVNIGKINGTAPTLTGSSLNVNCTGGCSSIPSYKLYYVN